MSHNAPLPIVTTIPDPDSFFTCAPSSLGRLLSVARSRGSGDLWSMASSRTTASVLSLLFLIAHATEAMGQRSPAMPTEEPPPFVVGQPLLVGPGSGTPLLADVDGDGHLDLLTRFLVAREISIHLGDGAGGFTPASGSPLRLPYPPAAALMGDLDHDGMPDLVVAPAYEDELDVWLYSPGGLRRAEGSPFRAGTPTQTNSKRVLHLADLDADGHLDGTTANGRNGTLVSYRGDGKGGLARPTVTRFDLSPSLDFRTFAFGDVDGDGKLDVIVATQPLRGSVGLGVQVLRGEGDGSYAQGFPLPDVPAGRMTLGDLNGDRTLDLVVAHDDLLRLYLNDSNGAFRQSPRSPVLANTPAWNVTIRDVDGDGRIDIVAATVDSVTVLLARDGGFALARGSPYPAGPGAYQLAVGDVNGDGRPDIVASSFEGDRLAILLAQ